METMVSGTDLPETMNPDLISDLIADIRQAAGLYVQVGATKKRQEELSEEVRSFEEEIAAVAMPATNL